MESFFHNIKIYLQSLWVAFWNSDTRAPALPILISSDKTIFTIDKITIIKRQ